MNWKIVIFIIALARQLSIDWQNECPGRSLLMLCEQVMFLMLRKEYVTNCTGSTKMCLKCIHEPQAVCNFNTNIDPRNLSAKLHLYAEDWLTYQQLNVCKVNTSDRNNLLKEAGGWNGSSLGISRRNIHYSQWKVLVCGKNQMNYFSLLSHNFIVLCELLMPCQLFAQKCSNCQEITKIPNSLGSPQTLCHW